MMTGSLFSPQQLAEAGLRPTNAELTKAGRLLTTGPLATRPLNFRCTPADSGSGPIGMTCGDCKHCYRSFSGRFHKCELTFKSWTHGTATDISVRWPACAKFEPTI